MPAGRHREEYKFILIQYVRCLFIEEIFINKAIVSTKAIVR
jgi:hypothetical protein